MAPEREPTDQDGTITSEENAKQGTTVLRTRFARLVFIGGLVLLILLALSTMFYPWREDTDQQQANPAITAPE
ncbi:UNVERIFIED_ORG: hypothetical protein BCL66_105283 [Martelella mediterranea]